MEEADERVSDDLTTDLGNLIPQWEELGISPDDFVRCGVCHRVLNFAALPEDFAEGDVCGCLDDEEGEESHGTQEKDSDS